MPSTYDQPSSWLGEEKVYGWRLHTPESGPAFLMRSIQTDGIMQSQDYAQRALVVTRTFDIEQQMRLYVNNSSLGLLLYAEPNKAIPASYYDAASHINDSISANP